MNANRDCGTIGLLTLDPLNVDHEFLSVAVDHFANLLALVVSANNLMQRDVNESFETENSS